jgi:hypothetical protein
MWNDLRDVRVGLQVAVLLCTLLALQSHAQVQAASEVKGTGAQTQPVLHVAHTLLPLTVEGTAYRVPVLASLPLDVPVWSVDGWKAGSLSEIRRDDSTDRRVSSFAVLDALLLTLLDRGRLPSLDMVVLAGHSAGAQFVQRYAAVGQAPTLLNDRGMQTRFIAANPSSYLYFDDRRPTEHGFASFPRTRCPAFDQYKYGLETPNAYVATQSTQAIMRQYARREMIYLLGTLDADAKHPFLDRSCAAEAQGPSHLARGEAYYRYLLLLLGHDVAHRHHLVLVGGVGHDDKGMFQSPCGAAWLFADGRVNSLPTGALSHQCPAMLSNVIGSAEQAPR